MRFFFLMAIGLNLLFSAVMPKDITARYQASFGFLDAGEMTVRLKIEEFAYEVDISVDSKGLARSLSSHRQERYISRGKHIRGEFIPDEYIKYIKNDDNWYDNSWWKFDHASKEISRHRERINDEKKLQVSDETLPYYAPNDPLTLYFNLPNVIDEVKEKGEAALYAISVNDKEGKVQILLPDSEKKREIKEKMESDEETILIVKMNGKVMLSSSGEVFFDLDDDFFSTRAYAEGIPLIGNARIKLLDKQIN